MLTIYKASAGSGKTFTLAREYILLLLGIKDVDAAAVMGNIVPGTAPRPYRLNLVPGAKPRLIENNRHRAILAITFTRKATEEMKERIIAQLSALAKNPDASPYVADLERDLHCSRSDLAMCAHLALKQLLFDYQNFNVSTIDSFFQRVLHTFARELDIQSNYTVEINDNDAMKAAVGMMLDQFNASAPGSTPIEAWLYDFMSDKIEEGAAGNFLNRQSAVHRSLVKQLSEIGRESFKPYFNPMKAYLARADKPLDRFRAAIARELRTIPTRIQSLAASTFGPGGVPAEWLFVKNFRIKIIPALIEGKEVKITDLTSTTYAEDMAGRNVARSPFLKGKGNEADADRVRAFFAELLMLMRRREYLKAVRDSLTQLSLLAYAWPQLDLFSKDNNTLLLSDTNHLLQLVIGGCETPFVYERMGMRLRHFLLDEFQDTSRMQWANLRPLVGNDINEQDSLVIGDEKQSIYRFRNSDSSILHSQVQSDFSLDYVTTGHEPDRNTNYRSSADVIRFNNTLFAIIAEKLGVSGYENVVQAIKPDNLAYRGMVRCAPKAKTVEETLDQMAEQILRQINEGGYRQSDIAILVDTNRHARKVVEHLIVNYSGRINVASDEALMVASSSAVQMTISVLKAIDQSTLAPEADDSPRGLYPTRTEVIRRINLYQYYLGKGCDPTASDDDKRLFATRAMLRALSLDAADSDMSIESVAGLHPDSLPALVEAVIYTQFTPEERERHGAYLCALLDAVADFAANNPSSLHGFIEWWDDKGSSLTLGSDNSAEAIKVMTLHKSKGLEFHCVHLPMCEWALGMSIKPNEVWTTIADYFTLSLKPQLLKDQPGLTDDQALDMAPPAVFVPLSSIHRSPDSPFADVYAAESRDAVSDALNKTYVAFTRAMSELCIWYKPVKSGQSIGYWLGQAFGAGLPTDVRPEAMVDLASLPADDGVITLGEPTIAAESYAFTQKKTVDYKPIVEAVPYAVYPIAGRDLLMGVDLSAETEANIDIAPDDGPLAGVSAETEAAPSAQALDTDSAEAMDMLQDGLTLHEIMARVMRPADLDRAVRLVCGRLRLDDATTAEYAKVARSLIEMPAPEIKRWFVDYYRVITESPIYIRSIDKTKRPDRVVVCPDGSIDIVDYKFTSKPSHAGIGAHTDQVIRYASLMRDMGHDRVRAYLVYPRLGRIIQVV